MEVMLFALAQQLKAPEFMHDLEEQKQLAVIALSNTTTSDETIRALEETLGQYVTALGLKR